MRCKLILRVEKQAFGNILPINYQYEQSAVIYRVLASGNENYAQWLHSNGFALDKKQFRLFNFSPLVIASRKQMGDRILIFSDTVEWYITFLPDKSTENFIKGIFTDRIFQLGDRQSKVQFQVQSVEALPPMRFESEMSFKTISPMVISRKEENGRIAYLSPLDPYVEDSVLYSLTEKYKAFYDSPFTEDISAYKFTLLNTPKEKLITIKAGTPEETKVKGYKCSFKICLPEILMKIMYETGIGSKGSQGFGMIKEEQP